PPHPPTPPLFPYTPLFRSHQCVALGLDQVAGGWAVRPRETAGAADHSDPHAQLLLRVPEESGRQRLARRRLHRADLRAEEPAARSEEHTSELQSRENLVCR